MSDSPEETSALQSIHRLIDSHHPIVYLVTWEETRALEALFSVAQAENRTLFDWSSASGLRKLNHPKEDRPIDEGTKDPTVAIQAANAYENPSVFVFKDLPQHFEDVKVIRHLRELASKLEGRHKSVILLSPRTEVPTELQKLVTLIDFPLPGYDQLKSLFLDMANLRKRRNRLTVSLSRVQARQMIEAALGLTLSEAKQAFAKAMSSEQELTASDIQLVLDEKRQIIRKSEVLDYFPFQETMASVGGLALLKEWLHERGRGFSNEARDFGLPPPKGLLLLGVSGCGKSLTAKVISSIWRMPLLRFDLGRVFGSFVGKSEENMRRAIHTAESIAPCVLWIDEIEKGLSGMKDSGASDAGTSSRVFSSLLFWLQEKTAPVFVVATANNIDHLPPELLRKGRFDEIFFVDLPTSDERKEIFSIHLTKRNRNPDDFSVSVFAEKSNGFSGAEIEQAVIAGLHKAFAKDRDLQNEDIESALNETTPLAITMREQIDAIRDWASMRARPAS